MSFASPPPPPPTAATVDAVAQSIEAALSSSSDSSSLSNVLTAFTDSSGNVTGNALAALTVLASVPPAQQITLVRQIQVNPSNQAEINSAVVETISKTLDSTPSGIFVAYGAGVEPEGGSSSNNSISTGGSSSTSTENSSDSGGSSTTENNSGANPSGESEAHDTTIKKNNTGITSSLLIYEEDARSDGVSAGDLVKPHGVWASGSAFMSYGRQGVIKGYAGYKNKSSGGSLGLDLKLSDRWMGGAALTYSKSVVDMCNYAAGSSYKTDSTMLTLYGMYLPTQRLFIRGSITYGIMENTNDSLRVLRYNKIKKDYIRVTADAYSKYKSNILSPDVTIGYRFGSRVAFSPSIGINYLRSTSKSRTESGAAPWNMRTRQKPKSGIWAGTLGLGLSTSFKWQDTFFMPEVHVSFRRTLYGQNPLSLVSFEGSSAVYVSKSKPTKKVGYSLGTSVTMIANKALNIALGYDASLGQKYVNHRGFVRVKLSF